MTIAMTMGVPGQLIEPEKAGDLERVLGTQLHAILPIEEDFAFSLTVVSDSLQFAFVGVPQKKVREHLREIATDVLMEQIQKWKRSLVLAEADLVQKIGAEGEAPPPALAQTLKSAKESRMRLDTFLLSH